VIHPIAFALSVLALLAVPGPTNTLLAGAGASGGLRRSLRLLAGELLGYLITITCVRLALGTVIGETAGAQTVVKIAVAAYLVFLAVRLWTAAPERGSTGFTVPRVFVTTLLNPKAFIFALFVFPASPTPIVPYYLGFSAMVVTVGASWIATGAALDRLTSARVGVIAPRLCACAMAVFAIVVVSGLFGR
jgi:threonine/homoserine/homoserine lactone efflux protein